MNLPTIDTYVNYSSGNYGAHALRVDFDNLTLWYSYNTIVAFRASDIVPEISPTSLVVRENDWGPTTGKHLNAIDGGDKKNRVPGQKFEEMLAAALKKLGLSN